MKIENKFLPTSLAGQKVEKKANRPSRAADSINKEPADKARRRFLKIAALAALSAAVNRMRWLELFEDYKGQKQKSQQQPLRSAKNENKSPCPVDSDHRPDFALRAKASQPAAAEKTAPIIDRADGRIIRVAQSFKDAYQEIAAKPEFFPAEIFTTDLFIAQQLQESGYDKKAHSRANAVGVMQIRAGAVADAGRYLNILKRRGQINYNGPQKLTDKEIAEILKLAKADANLGRAIGKIYMAMLFSHYRLGQKDYQRGRIKEAQKKILAAYNAGQTRIKRRPERFWPRESRQYYRRIFVYMERLKTVRQHLKKLNLNLANENYAAMRLVKKMSQVRSLAGQKVILSQCLKALLKAASVKDLRQQKVLSDKEVDLALEKVVLGPQLAQAR